MSEFPDIKGSSLPSIEEIEEELQEYQSKDD
jgi:hypothetical protein